MHPVTPSPSKQPRIEKNEVQHPFEKAIVPSPTAKTSSPVRDHLEYHEEEINDYADYYHKEQNDNQDKKPAAKPKAKSSDDSTLCIESPPLTDDELAAIFKHQDVMVEETKKSIQARNAGSEELQKQALQARRKEIERFPTSETVYHSWYENIQYLSC
jgi:hypothetical protein